MKMSQSKKSFALFMYGVLIVSAIIFSTLSLGPFGTRLNNYIFGKKQISNESDKIQLAKTLGVYFSSFLLVLTMMVMFLRIFTGKVTPAAGGDPQHINLINRILSNSIEQGLIFAGLYGAMLFGSDSNFQQIGGVRLMTLASLFVVGRVTFAVGYIIATITGIPTLRSFGFATHIFINLMMFGHHLGFQTFNGLDKNVVPILSDTFLKR